MAQIPVHSPLVRLRLSGSLLLLILGACTPLPPVETLVPPPAAATSSWSAEIPTLPATPEGGAAAARLTVTPRPPDLTATDPATVKLASGGLLLVEFFRFT